jgi:hypothetical protein
MWERNWDTTALRGIGDQDWNNSIIDCIAIGQKSGYEWQLIRKKTDLL